MSAKNLQTAHNCQDLPRTCRIITKRIRKETFTTFNLNLKIKEIILYSIIKIPLMNIKDFISSCGARGASSSNKNRNYMKNLARSIISKFHLKAIAFQARILIQL